MAAAGASSIALAGCIGDDDDDDDPGDDDGTVDDDDGDVDDDWDESDLDGITLDVAIWSGDYGDDFEERVAPVYEEEYGVNLDIHHEWGEILANIRAAPEDDPPYDVTVTDGVFYSLGWNEGLYLPIREENVPNLEEIHPTVLEWRGAEYGVPVDMGAFTLIWTDELEWSEGHPESFADLLTEDGQNANTALEGWVEYALHTAALASDRGLDAIYEDEDWDYLFGVLDDMNVDHWIEGGAQLDEWMRTGSVDLSQYYTTSAWLWMQQGAERDWALPDETITYLDHFCVVRGTDYRRESEHFINWLASAEAQTEWSKEVPQFFSNQNMEYGEFDGLEEQFPRTDEDFAENVTVMDWDFLLPRYDELDERFQRELVEG